MIVRPIRHQFASLLHATYVAAITRQGYVHYWYGWRREPKNREKRSHEARFVTLAHQLDANNGDLIFLDDPEADQRLAQIKGRAVELGISIVLAYRPRSNAA